MRANDLEKERLRLNAIARANEVFNALTLIASYRDQIRTLMQNHDATVAHNAAKRNCEAFHERLRDLNLEAWVKRELALWTDEKL